MSDLMLYEIKFQKAHHLKAIISDYDTFAGHGLAALSLLTNFLKNLIA